MRLAATLLLLLSCMGCSCAPYNYPVYVSGNIHKNEVERALKIIINELDILNVFSKKQMFNVINKLKYTGHNHCKDKNHNLRITFVKGEYSENFSRNCIPTTNKKFSNLCVSGLFDGTHNIRVLRRNNVRLHKTSLAHELIHYFAQHIPDSKIKAHKPKSFWTKFVGFQAKGEVGILNERLKKEGL